MLLAYIVEKVSGESYEAFLRENFFQPLGMTNTGVYRSDLTLTHEAVGYSYEDGKFKRAMNWDMSWLFGPGGLYSTVEDLYRWNEGLFKGKVLNEASLKVAFTPVKTKENQDNDLEEGYSYGYGWAIAHLRGWPREISHEGVIHGFRSFLLRLPKENFTVTILANSTPGAPGIMPSSLAHELVKIYLGDKFAPPRVAVANKDVSPKAFDAVVGRYDRGDFVVNVTREGDHLFMQFAGPGKVEIFPASETEFFWKDADHQITFVKDKSGKVVKAVHHAHEIF